MPVKSLDTSTHSRVFLYLYYFLHCRIIVKTLNLEITHVVTKKSVKQICSSCRMLWHYTVWMTSYVICYYMLCKSLHTSCYNRVLYHLSSVSHYYIEMNDVRHNHVIFPYRVWTYTLCITKQRTRYKKTQHKIESPIMGKRAD